MKNKSGKIIGCNSSLCSGSKKFIVGLRKVLRKNIKNIKSKIHMHRTPKGTIMASGKPLQKNSITFNLDLSPNNTKLLRDYMYSTPCSLKMIRKYNRFMEAGEYRPGPGDMHYMNFTKAKKLMATKNFGSMNDYYIWIKNNRDKINLPASPNVVYDQWKGWGDFLGHYRIPYKELSKLAIRSNIQNEEEYYEWIKKERNGMRGKYPRNPGNVYNEWKGWNIFLGKSE